MRYEKTIIEALLVILLLLATINYSKFQNFKLFGTLYNALISRND